MLVPSAIINGNFERGGMRRTSKKRMIISGSTACDDRLDLKF